MLKCLVISGPTRFEALAFKNDLAQGITRVADIGYDGVELAICDPGQVDAVKIGELLKQLKLPLVAVGTGQAYGDEGLSFTCPDQAVRRRAVDRIKDHIEFAAKFKAMVIIGLIRGKVQPGVDREQSGEWMLSALQECAGYAGGFNVDLLLEPINRYETDLVNSVPDALDVISLVGSPALKILFDTFHANIEEVSITESLRMTARLLGHVHVADSNRWAPGCGHIDFHGIAKTLQDMGYKGAVSAEILPKPDPDSSAAMAISYLRRIGL